MTNMVILKITKLTTLVNIIPSIILTKIINFLFLVLFENTGGIHAIKEVIKLTLLFYKAMEAFKKDAENQKKEKQQKEMLNVQKK